jgi:hypothetical protein
MVNKNLSVKNVINKAYNSQPFDRVIILICAAIVRLVDFGIHGFNLAYALLDHYDVTPRGQEPGILYVIEPDLRELNEADMQATSVVSAFQ